MIDPKPSFQPFMPLEIRHRFSRICHRKRLLLDPYHVDVSSATQSLPGSRPVRSVGRNKGLSMNRNPEVGWIHPANHRPRPFIGRLVDPLLCGSICFCAMLDPPTTAYLFLGSCAVLAAPTRAARNDRIKKNHADVCAIRLESPIQNPALPPTTTYRNYPNINCVTRRRRVHLPPQS